MARWTDTVPLCLVNKGCKCSACYGLAEWLDDHGIDHGLPPTVVKLNVDTFTGPKAADVLAPACVGGYTCICAECSEERADRVRAASMKRAA